MRTLISSPQEVAASRQAGSNWAVRSRLKTEHGYGRFLQFLRGALFDPATEPTERVTRENVEAYVAELSSCCAPYTVATRMQELCDAMRVLAPGQDWSWMRQLSERLYARAQPSVDKRPRLRPSGELQAFGRKLMTTAEHNQGAGDKKWAVMYRDKLIISLLAYRPLRVRNFSTIRIGINLLQDGTGYLIRFNGNETKQGQSVESVFPKSLAANLRRYLDHYRTILLTVGAAQPIDTDALWISLRGTPLSPRSLANPINKRTRVASVSRFHLIGFATVQERRLRLRTRGTLLTPSMCWAILIPERLRNTIIGLAASRRRGVTKGSWRRCTNHYGSRV